ncbi:MAG: hypothetical protein ACE5IY_06860 [bacterium]
MLLHFGRFSLLMIATLSCLTACVQRSRKGANHQTIAQAVGSLKSGDKVQIASSRTGRIEGRFVRRSGEVIQLEYAQDEIEVPLSEIESLKVRRGTAGQGARGVAIVVGVLGTLAGTMLHGLCKSLDESEDPEGCPRFIFLGAAAGAAAGAILGAGLGALNRKWRPLYP